MKCKKSNNTRVKQFIPICFVGLVILFLTACNESVVTGFNEVDKNYSFRSIEVKHTSELQLKRYFFREKSDSVYTVIAYNSGEVDRGWTYKFKRIGDWYFENKNQSVDSIVNYITYCGGLHHMNTIKHFYNNEPQLDSGFWHEFVYDSIDIRRKKAFELELKVNYDKTRYEGTMYLCLFNNPVYHADYCDFKSFTKDSIFSYGDDFYNVRITPQDQGVNSIQGYYTLLPKKQRKIDESKNLKVVFFRLDFDAK